MASSTERRPSAPPPREFAARAARRATSEANSSLRPAKSPPLSSPASTGGASSASADTGRASQIASFTSAIWWVSATKRW